MKLYIADAFTDKLFGGNPAGVVIFEDGEDFPAAEIMRKTAAELRYSETAFIKQLSEKEFNIRYFTPADEVDLCGHATIASFSCLLDAGLVKDGEDYINHTLAGTLNIGIKDGFIMMDMAVPEYIGTISAEADLRELYDIMGLPYAPVETKDVYDEEIQLLPMMISTGLPDIIMPVQTRCDLEEISPDFARLTELSKRYNVVGVHAFTLDAADETIRAHCRNFAPLYDIDEEAATGTSNGALTYYLYKNDILKTGNSSAFVQGEAMDRPSRILSWLDEAGKNSDADVCVRVGGSAIILAKGTILL
ncbi:MAG: PhzF family phenazine biosynthesis protein [Firmicutes bacterium]|nr:PhzF family phenazine biosynthesis protein [Bacillota bacterium]